MVARIRSKGTSVSIGCFGRHWNRRESEEKALLEELLSVWDVDENVAIYLYLLGSDVGPFWSQGLEGTSVTIVGLRCGIIVVARIRRSFCQYRMWTRMCSSTGVPMWDHYGRKD